MLNNLKNHSDYLKYLLLPIWYMSWSDFKIIIILSFVSGHQSAYGSPFVPSPRGTSPVSLSTMAGPRGPGGGIFALVDK